MRCGTPVGTGTSSPPADSRPDQRRGREPRRERRHQPQDRLRDVLGPMVDDVIGPATSRAMPRWPPPPARRTLRSKALSRRRRGGVVCRGLTYRGTRRRRAPPDGPSPADSTAFTRTHRTAPSARGSPAASDRDGTRRSPRRPSSSAACRPGVPGAEMEAIRDPPTWPGGPGVGDTCPAKGLAPPRAATSSPRPDRAVRSTPRQQRCPSRRGQRRMHHGPWAVRAQPSPKIRTSRSSGSPGQGPFRGLVTILV